MFPIFLMPLMIVVALLVAIGARNGTAQEARCGVDGSHVKSPSPRFAHDVLHLRAMEYLMGPLPQFGEPWFSKDAVFMAVPGDPAPALVDAHLRMLTGFADHLRPDVLEEVGTLHRQVDDSGPGVSLAEQDRPPPDAAAGRAGEPGAGRAVTRGEPAGGVGFPAG